MLRRSIQGSGSRSTAGNATIIAAPGVGKRLSIIDLAITIHTIIATGKAEITDGTTTYWAWDAITAGSGQPPMLHFPQGFDFPKNKGLVLTTTGNCVIYVTAVAGIK